MCNFQWIQTFALSNVAYLNRTNSDHSPLLLSLILKNEAVKRSFRFQNFWSKHNEFQSIVKKAWSIDCTGDPLRIFSQKLKETKQALSLWNKDTFKNIFQATIEAKDDVLLKETQPKSNFTEVTNIEYKQAKAKLQFHLSLEDEFWRQKARIKWLQEGDENSKNFNAMVNQRRNRLVISRIKDSNGNWTSDPISIKNQFSDYFKSILSSPTYIHEDASLLNHIPHLITENDNILLSAPPSIDEIKLAIDSMDSSSTTCPDGFNSLFYKQCWDTIKADLFKAISSFFMGNPLPKSWTSTLLTLIPKTDNPSSYNDYRPISLCNTSNKII